MVDQTEPSVLVTRSPGLMVLVLNRPRVLNTLNLEMIRLLRRALEAALAAADVGVALGATGDSGSALHMRTHSWCSASLCSRASCARQS